MDNPILLMRKRLWNSISCTEQQGKDLTSFYRTSLLPRQTLKSKWIPIFCFKKVLFITTIHVWPIARASSQTGYKNIEVIIGEIEQEHVGGLLCQGSVEKYKSSSWQDACLPACLPARAPHSEQHSGNPGIRNEQPDNLGCNLWLPWAWLPVDYRSRKGLEVGSSQECNHTHPSSQSKLKQRLEVKVHILWAR